MEKQALGKEAWILAALEVLGVEGVAQVRVEPLARKLGVTKGSFYWHFANRDDLLDALLDHWQRLATADIIAHVETAASAPAARLERLVSLVSRSREAPNVESAIRAWGVSDAKARRRLAAIDEQRERYVRDLLVAHGLSAEVAAMRSRALYLMLIGEFAWVAHQGKPSSPAVWREILAMLLALS
jgi:AcrR family transcriptional regulator